MEVKKIFHILKAYWVLMIPEGWINAWSSVIYEQPLFKSNLAIVLSILGACKLGAQIKDLYIYVWKKN